MRATISIRGRAEGRTVGALAALRAGMADQLAHQLDPLEISAANARRHAALRGQECTA
jgi:hypothetical protein